jgi:urease subunit alpha
MAAEGPLHDLGAISIVNSDSQGMGRIGETVRRTWQLAHVMKAWAGEGAADDNERVLRYLAKYTVEPARTHGIEREVGSLAPGRLADIVLWRPGHFGVKPELILKAGHFAWGAIGEGNATVESVEPTRYGPHWGAMGPAAAALSTTFVSRAALGAGLEGRIRSARRFVAVEGTRSIGRDDLVSNRAAPPIEVDPADGTVTLEGRVLAIEPVDHVPLSRRYAIG